MNLFEAMTQPEDPGAVVSEKPYKLTEQERESVEAREALWNALGRRPDELYVIASALTSAEERGRRRGDKRVELVRRMATSWTDMGDGTQDSEWSAEARKALQHCGRSLLLATSASDANVDQRLAPRDSAPPTPGITPVDARALYAAVQHVCWDQTETDRAAEKLKAIGESDGVAIWDPRRPRSDGSQIGWVAPRNSAKEDREP